MASDESACCGGGPSACEDFTYGPQQFEQGEVTTPSGPVPQVSSELTRADRLGAIRMRWNIGRGSYRVRPGLYAIGDPDAESAVLVTANYKLTFDRVRAALGGRSAWLLVLDTKGINVWCAAGKGTFGTKELVRRIIESGLDRVVSHDRIVVPQLGATGVCAREVRSISGFRVSWGPVRVEDLPAFLDAGMKSQPEMRRVRFGLRDRAVLVPVELSFLWRMRTLLGIALLLGAGGLWRAFTAEGFGGVPGAIVVALLGAFVAGSALVPIALPWIPGRAFSLKGALAGLAVGAVVGALWFEPLGLTRAILLAVLAAAVSSIPAMFFTGSSTYTSPSGVEREMRLALPLQTAAIAVSAVGLIVMAVVSR